MVPAVPEDESGQISLIATTSIHLDLPVRHDVPFQLCFRASFHTQGKRLDTVSITF
jgi:hypothetical protein